MGRKRWTIAGVGSLALVGIGFVVCMNRCEPTVSPLVPDSGSHSRLGGDNEADSVAPVLRTPVAREEAVTPLAVHAFPVDRRAAIEALLEEGGVGIVECFIERVKSYRAFDGESCEKLRIKVLLPERRIGLKAGRYFTVYHSPEMSEDRLGFRFPLGGLRRGEVRVLVVAAERASLGPIPLEGHLFMIAASPHQAAGLEDISVGEWEAVREFIGRDGHSIVRGEWRRAAGSGERSEGGDGEMMGSFRVDEVLWSSVALRAGIVVQARVAQGSGRGSSSARGAIELGRGQGRRLLVLKHSDVLVVRREIGN